MTVAIMSLCHPSAHFSSTNSRQNLKNETGRLSWRQLREVLAVARCYGMKQSLLERLLFVLTVLHDDAR